VCSNGAVAEDDQNDLSPWARDDWVVESAVPDASVFADRRARRAVPGPPVERGEPGEPAPDNRPSSRSGGRRMAAAALVAVLVAGASVALWRNADDSGAEPPASTAADPPNDTSSAAGPPTTELDDADPVVDSAEVTTTTVAGGGALDVVPAIQEGEVPAWSERTIAVPEPLATIAATEVATLSQDGILSVTEFPSGRSRSIDVSSIGPSLQLTMGEGTILVFGPNAALQLRDGEVPVRSSLPAGVIFAEPWTGTGSFILTSPSTGPGTPEQELVLERDGTLRGLDQRLADESDFFWSRSFSPTGAALVSRPGGVYSIDPTGAVERISTGDLLATGTRHWAIEECDEALRCAYSVVSWDTGEVTRAYLDPIARLGYLDPATHISPDGRSVTYRFDADGTSRRMILDVATGDEITAGVANQFVYPDAWAADSSGLFVTDRDLVFVDRTTGAATEIPDLGRVAGVATGSFAR
jgi:hypothetical protein